MTDTLFRDLAARTRSSRKFGILAATIFLAGAALAQAPSKVTAVDPASGKVSDSVTVTGQSLGKESVSAVFLSDDSMDFKAAMTEQSAEKIVMKVPKVKAGNYNVSIQVGERILIEPVKFKVEE
jgi:IPT/TIG domain-containing protein